MTVVGGVGDLDLVMISVDVRRDSVGCRMLGLPFGAEGSSPFVAMIASLATAIVLAPAVLRLALYSSTVSPSSRITGSPFSSSLSLFLFLLLSVSPFVFTASASGSGLDRGNSELESSLTSIR